MKILQDMLIATLALMDAYQVVQQGSLVGWDTPRGVSHIVGPRASLAVIRVRAATYGRLRQ